MTSVLVRDGVGLLLPASRLGATEPEDVEDAYVGV